MDSADNKNKIINRLLSLLLVVFGFTLVTMAVVQLSGGADQLRTVVENAGPWAPAVYLTVKVLTYIVAPLSGVSIELAAGALFGAWLGTALSLIGSTLGAVINYWIARTLGRAGIVKFAGKKALIQVDHTTEHVANWRVLLVARLFLSVIYDFISYAAGLTRIPFNQFLIVSLFGGIIPNMVFPFIGNASAAHQSGNYILMIIFAVLFIVVAFALLYRRRRTKQ